jgi:DNA-binding transcriptional LysR family regulator
MVLLFNPDMIQAQSIIRKAKLVTPRNIYSESLENIAALADAGAGIAILPTRVAKHWKQLKRLPMPHFEDEVTLLYRSENRNILALKELAKRIERGMA